MSEQEKPETKAAHLENGLRAIMVLTEPSAHAHDLLGTVHRTAKACLRQTPPISTAEKSSAVGNAAKLFKTVDLRFDICRNIEQVLGIGRDFQNKDGFRGAHYDTVKLLCDTIEYQQEQLKTKTEVGDCAKLREFARLVSHMNDDGYWNGSASICALVSKAKAALAAPPRNCDKYTTGKQVEDACADERGCPGCFREDLSSPCVSCTVSWLLASATEKEGGKK